MAQVSPLSSSSGETVAVGFLPFNGVVLKGRTWETDQTKATLVIIEQQPHHSPIISPTFFCWAATPPESENSDSLRISPGGAT